MSSDDQPNLFPDPLFEPPREFPMTPLRRPRPFDSAESARRRDDAIDRVEAASDDWIQAALTCVERIANGRPRFTTDDVWAELDATSTEEVPSDPRAMGAVMRKARIAKIAEPTSETRPSSMISNHRRPIRIWRSLRGGAL